MIFVLLSYEKPTTEAVIMVDTSRNLHVTIHGEDVKMTRVQIRAMREMTALQRDTALNILAGMDDMDAYRAAGGNGPSSVSVTKHPKVIEFLDSFAVERVGPAIMCRDEMLERLTAIARTQVDDVVKTYTGRQLMDMETGEVVDGQTLWSLRPVEEMRNGGVSAIKKMTANRNGLTVELHDSMDAMKRLAEMQGYDAPKKVEVGAAPSLADFYAGLTHDDSGETDG